MDEILSRDRVAAAAKSKWFGLNEDTVVLDYVYNSDELKRIYGETFLVEDIGGTSSGQIVGFFFFKIQPKTNHGVYRFEIAGDHWIAEISKEPRKKWRVDKIYQEKEGLLR
jgi:hypothetical protein